MIDQFQKNLIPGNIEKPRDLWSMLEGSDEDQNTFMEIRSLSKNLLKQMKPSIDRGDYSVIIGIDASGRVPALVFDKVIKGIYQKKGYDAPKTFFFQGLRRTELNESDLKKIESDLLKLPLPEGDKIVLVVDDVVSTGKSIRPIADFLGKSNKTFDLASLAIFGLAKTTKATLKKNFSNMVNCFIGDDELGDPEIHKKIRISGVKKDIEHGYSKLEVYKDGEELYYRDFFDRATVIEARHNVDVIADDLIAWYEKQE